MFREAMVLLRRKKHERKFRRRRESVASRVSILENLMAKIRNVREFYISLNQILCYHNEITVSFTFMRLHLQVKLRKNHIQQLISYAKCVGKCWANLNSQFYKIQFFFSQLFIQNVQTINKPPLNWTFASTLLK